MEINKCTHQWRLEGEERALFGIRDCLRVLRRGRQFCTGRLLPGVFSSKAAIWVTYFRLSESHGPPGCARVQLRLEHADLTSISSYNRARFQSCIEQSGGWAFTECYCIPHKLWASKASSLLVNNNIIHLMNVLRVVWIYIIMQARLA